MITSTRLRRLIATTAGTCVLALTLPAAVAANPITVDRACGGHGYTSAKGGGGDASTNGAQEAIESGDGNNSATLRDRALGGAGASGGDASGSADCAFGTQHTDVSKNDPSNKNVGVARNSVGGDVADIDQYQKTSQKLSADTFNVIGKQSASTGASSGRVANTGVKSDVHVVAVQLSSADAKAGDQKISTGDADAKAYGKSSANGGSAGLLQLASGGDGTGSASNGAGVSSGNGGRAEAKIEDVFGGDGGRASGKNSAGDASNSSSGGSASTAGTQTANEADAGDNSATLRNRAAGGNATGTATGGALSSTRTGGAGGAAAATISGALTGGNSGAASNTQGASGGANNNASANNDGISAGGAGGVAGHTVLGGSTGGNANAVAGGTAVNSLSLTLSNTGTASGNSGSATNSGAASNVATQMGSAVDQAQTVGQTGTNGVTYTPSATTGAQTASPNQSITTSQDQTNDAS
jgi:hypothetical protein